MVPTASTAATRPIPSDPAEAAPPPRAVPWRALAVVAGCVALAIASLPLPAALGYDPRAWLVWGREVGRLSLDTTGGPAWKPLPVLATTPGALSGDLAPAVWMVTARTAGLLAVLGVGRLAARLAGPAAGWIAGGLLLLTPDVESRYLRLVAEGHSAPLTAALAVWACERHLAGHHRTAVLLAAGLALDRPEAWPFVGAYLVWSWWREPGTRTLVAVTAVAVPVLWFGADWWGSGQLLHGADVAQVDADDTDRLRTSLWRAAAVVPAAVWLPAAAAVAFGIRGRDRVVTGLAAGLIGWMALVVTMSTFLGYAAIGRFHLPAAAILCVLAGVGVVRVVGAVPAGRWRVGIVAGMVLVAGLAILPRVVALAPLAREVQARAQLDDDLDRAVAAAGGPEVVGSACGRVITDEGGFPRMSMAWTLDLPLGQVDLARTAVRGPAAAIVTSDRRLDRAYAATPGRATLAARNRSWAVYAVDCPDGLVEPDRPR